MGKICKGLFLLFGALSLVACDLEPKISSLPDAVGDFISSRYPALLADPDTQPEIYNSAAGDYGVYASPELYGGESVGDYVNYVSVDDYVLAPAAQEKTEEVVAADTTETVAEKHEPEPEVIKEPDGTPKDTLVVPEYKRFEFAPKEEPKQKTESVVSAVPVANTPTEITVKQGDTLYALARANNIAFKDLVEINKLSEPYTLRVGQVLKLRADKPVVVETKPVKIEVKEQVKVATPAPAPVSTTAKKVEVPIRVPVKTIRVSAGDTLYSLSRKYEIPVNDLAVMNNLSAPFTLSVDQALRVPDLPTAEPVVTATKPVDTNPKTETSKTVSTAKTAVKTDVPAKTGAVKTETKTATTNKKTETKKTEVKKPETKKTEAKKPEVKKTETKPATQKTSEVKKTQTTKKSETITKIVARSSSKFSWPVRGSILSHFGAKTGGLYNDGINISAALNTTVRAAENGVVAYAGNEIRGMGNLIIIQHADGWMTVYAHLNSMSVRRGATVTVGQKIGAVGKTGKVTSPQLHFEVRKGTKAYNPTNYLKK